jgi:toxin ParE1/3/4
LGIERHPAVIDDDLPHIHAHIARDYPAAADRVLDAMAETFAHIAAHPESGVLYPTRKPQMKTVRMLPVNGFNNYLVFYRIEADVVRILYVVHGAWLLPRLFGRELRE